jgi:hypothetical protein
MSAFKATQSENRGNTMKTWITTLALSTAVLCAPLAHANTHKEAPMGGASCEAKAAEKKLAGAAKTSFMKKCETDNPTMAPAAADSCEAKAAEKKLAGAAKTSFVKKCGADGKAAGAAASCDAKAAEKKLAGAAKNSFVKKCTADAAA